MKAICIESAKQAFLHFAAVGPILKESIDILNHKRVPSKLENKVNALRKEFYKVLLTLDNTICLHLPIYKLILENYGTSIENLDISNMLRFGTITPILDQLIELEANARSLADELKKKSKDVWIASCIFGITAAIAGLGAIAAGIALCCTVVGAPLGIAASAAGAACVFTSYGALEYYKCYKEFTQMSKRVAKYTSDVKEIKVKAQNIVGTEIQIEALKALIKEKDPKTKLLIEDICKIMHETQNAIRLAMYGQFK